MLKRPLAGRKSRGESVLWCRQILSKCSKQGNVILTLAAIRRMLPINYITFKLWLRAHHYWSTYCQSHRFRSAVLAPMPFERIAHGVLGLEQHQRKARCLYHHHQQIAPLGDVCTSSSAMQMSSNSPAWPEYHRLQVFRFVHRPIRR